MKKIFEIPLYAIDEKELKKRVAQYLKKNNEFYNCTETNEEIIKNTVLREIYPKNVWNYNHIIGYIVVYIKKNEIIFQRYSPYKEVKRYVWNTDRKKYLCDSLLNGARIPISKTMTNGEISDRISCFIDRIAGDVLNRNQVMDKSAFVNIYKYIDYRQLLNEME